MLTASRDGTARIWVAATGQPLTPPWKHPAEVTSAEFSPDGRQVITVDASQIARIWTMPCETAGLPNAPVADLRALARFLSSRQPDGNGDLEPKSESPQLSRWNEMQRDFPDIFSPVRGGL